MGGAGRKRARSSSCSSTTSTTSKGKGCSPERAPPPSHFTTAAISGKWKPLFDRAVLTFQPATPAVRTFEHGGHTHVKVASFDLDDTLVFPASGLVFPKDDPADWQWLHPNVPRHLRALDEAGYLLVVFTNQLGINKRRWNEAKAAALQEKMCRIESDLQVPLVVFAATCDDRWRKPNTDMWGLLQDYIEANIDSAARDRAIDCSKYSFYVGDAAGRTGKTLAGRKKDFSCSDRKFAHNLSLQFLTPEQLFLVKKEDLLDERPGVGRALQSQLLERVNKSKEPFDWGGPSPLELQQMPSSYAGLTTTVITAAGESKMTIKDPMRDFARSGQQQQQELVLFVGYPGCGKSTFYRRFFEPHRYLHVNRDTLKTKERCLRAAEEAWTQGRSVVIDNTNPSSDDRLPYISMIKKHVKTAGPLPVRAFVFGHSRELAVHFNVMRSRAGISAAVPSIVYNMFNSRYTPYTPQVVAAEGIECAVVVPPVKDFLGLPKERELSMMLHRLS